VGRSNRKKQAKLTAGMREAIIVCKLSDGKPKTNREAEILRDIEGQY
jgi:hypothetical protein